jgi:hypothetical protein
MARKKVIDLDTYTQLDAWAISLHEMYRALRRAGFAVDMALAIITDRDSYPEWILPSIPDRVDRLPYEDDEDED